MTGATHARRWGLYLPTQGTHNRKEEGALILSG
ncbi:MAG: hypothetical protein KatS3mg051_0136 [Anaerolineae bacterium]|nr:MAG: hypothetical protein KatS3mg051_0136 [Anaerolineae bacterium]